VLWQQEICGMAQLLLAQQPVASSWGLSAQKSSLHVKTQI
jgi:hypothetical protein